MAPPVPVYTRDEVKMQFPQYMMKFLPSNCELYSIIQNQCTFSADEIICVPFKRVFAKCRRGNQEAKRNIIPENGGLNLTGKKLIPREYTVIEVTDSLTNKYDNSSLMDRFFEAERDLMIRFQEYEERNSKEGEIK
ncbi:Mitochondrial inner membrane peptidase [Komagataella phaffii CBS 7435]|uniref:Uncharacterized protein n=2 Tax=Komagataella phaffii TaxID=460519 RepID=C4R131_KOMPG|nr:Hypothetical protein PAS_chr2-1_0569 [Komagataella phaffii GS115]AOA62556.1 GQ67_00625T0 [Komagataella phaffii]CAH2448269.1 Mitochondrial inner membrane peptidase [Komagataella phaffii CBS 7435]AOA67885.1 GQ68_00763T0 [Komagataella phaffii GS115]CAY69205.1 Hypothetical protein PAS_chr2-1_0569 [Komagataella phaffii GS115]SCV12051.1 Mitochondrial inner membrane peptidase [Komagataella phaffii CBS 7435]